MAEVTLEQVKADLKLAEKLVANLKAQLVQLEGPTLSVEDAEIAFNAAEDAVALAQSQLTRATKDKLKLGGDQRFKDAKMALEDKQKELAAAHEALARAEGKTSTGDPLVEWFKNRFNIK